MSDGIQRRLEFPRVPLDRSAALAMGLATTVAVALVAPITPALAAVAPVTERTHTSGVDHYGCMPSLATRYFEKGFP